MDNSRNEQAQILARLQTKWLKHMERLLDEGTITSTDLATLFRFLHANGWTLDASKLSPQLRDKLGDRIDPTKFDDDDADVIAGRIGVA